MKPNNHFLATIGIYFTILCWGSAYVAARYLLHSPLSTSVSLSPLLLAALRFSLASLFFVFPLLRAIIRRHISLRDLLLMALLGQLTFSLYYWLQYIGIQETNASVSSLLGVGLIPLFTTVLAPFFGREKLRLSLSLLLALGFLGVVLIIFQHPFSFTLQSGFLFGSLCLVTNTFFFALYTHLSKRWMQTISPLIMTSGTMVSGALGLLFLSLILPGETQWSLILRFDGSQWFALLFLAIACSIIAYFAYNVALTKTDASRVAVYFYFEPLVSIILGVVLLGEHLTWQVIAGGILIAGSVVAVQQLKKPEQNV